MVNRLVRYRVRADEVATVEAAIQAFVRAVSEHEPATKYTTYRARNSTSFAHFMQFPDEGAEQRHRDAAYTRAFTDVLYARCDAGPTFTELEEVAHAGMET
jgi:quinol monooxygenase YgiN